MQQDIIALNCNITLSCTPAGSGISNKSMLHMLVIIIAFLLTISVGETKKRDLYVKPTSTSTGCPQDEVCITFSDYLQNVSDYFTSNTAIHFLTGNHTIKSNERSHHLDHLLVSDVHNLSLSGYTGVTALHCTQRFGLAFMNVKNLRISDIRIINCGQTIIARVATEFDGFYPSTKAALTLVNIHSLVLHNVQIKASYGYGLIGVNVFGNSTITNCTFTHNTWRSDDANASSTPKNSYARPGGNAVLAYPKTQQFPNISPDALHILRCEFAYGNNTNTFDFPKHIGSYSRLMSWGSGLGILLYEQILLIKINIVNSVFHHNDASYGLGANMFVISHGTTEGTKLVSAVDISNCILRSGNAVQGGGIYVYESRNIAGAGQLAVRLSNSTITNNSAKSGGGLKIIVDLPNIELADAQEPFFRIENSVFSDNKAIQGAAVDILGYGGFCVTTVTAMVTSIHINISQTTLLHNVAEKNGSGIHIDFIFTRTGCDDLSTFGSASVLLSNSTLMGNNGSTVYATASKVIVSGAVKVFDNHGVSGGGFYFDCNSQSYIYLTPHSQLYMANNTASLHGGAMAAKDCNPIDEKCFIQIFDKDEECLQWFNKLNVNKSQECNDTMIIMENNSAEFAGDSVYGGSLETCYILLSGEHIYFNMLHSRIFEIHNKLSLSEIASDPFQVCFCSQNFNMNPPQCVDKIQTEVYYGQTLHIPAVATGQFNNTSPALIRTRIITDINQIFLGERQKFQELGRDCVSLLYLFNFSQKRLAAFNFIFLLKEVV